MRWDLLVEKYPPMTTTTPSQEKTAQALPGYRDPLQVLSQTPYLLARIVKEHTAEQMRTRPFENKWTPNEIIGHLSDAEWAFGWRMRLVLGDQDPVVSAFDQDGWVSAQRLNDRDPGQLVEMLGQLRKWNVVVWKQLTPADLERVGRGSGQGAVSLGELLRTFAQHDLHHLDQIKRYLEAIRASG